MPIGKRHAVVGNLNLDLTVYLDRMPGPDESVSSDLISQSIGGAAVNYSVASARYGHKPFLIGVTSKLYVDLGMLGEIAEKGVDISNVRVVEKGMPGIAIILQVRGGQRRIISYRGVNALLDKKMVGRALRSLDGTDLIQFSSTHPSLLYAVAESRSRALVAYDPGTQLYRTRIDLRDVLFKTDILFLNEAEARVFLPENPSDLLRRIESNVIIVVKRGERGAVAYTREGIVEEKALKITPVDTTGAGDAFNAVFNAAFLEGDEIRVALKKAVIAGSLKALRKGSAESPSRREIEEMMAKL